MPHRTDDLRIKSVRPLLSAAILIEEVPLRPEDEVRIAGYRQAIDHSRTGEDDRIVVVVGPCSIHDPVAAIDYAQRLKEVADELGDDLIVIMRTYFEKPRTVVGWKGLINDPFFDGSFRVNDGIRIARQLLVQIARIGLPTATEFLDTTLPQHIADSIAWGAIGARTTESQTHREMASGLSMPVGFKNATDGSVKVAIDAIQAARHGHWFAGATKDGISAFIETTGNASCHLILRGGESGPNYQSESVQESANLLMSHGLKPQLMVDFSHANSSKNHLKQLEVGADIADQLSSPDSPIFGVMIESFIEEGRQDIKSDGTMIYGKSITDACLSWKQTVPLLQQLAHAVRTRRGRK